MANPPTQPPAVRGRPVGPNADDSFYGRDLQVGAQVGGYVVLELIARGGFASIYKAKHAKLSRLAAIKVLHRFLLSSANMVRRFQQEAEAVNLIHHPNVIDIYEFGDLSDGRPYCVMEWLQRQDLERELKSHRRKAPPDVLSLVRGLAASPPPPHRPAAVHPSA